MYVLNILLCNCSTFVEFVFTSMNVKHSVGGKYINVDVSRQNLNSDFTDSALGSSEKSPLPYGNFQLRESTVQSILSHPRYGPKLVSF